MVGEEEKAAGSLVYTKEGNEKTRGDWEVSEERREDWLWKGADVPPPEQAAACMLPTNKVLFIPRQLANAIEGGQLVASLKKTRSPPLLPF